MTPAVTLAVAELRMLARNRTAAGTALLFPLGIGLVWARIDAPVAQAAGIAGLQLLMVLSFTVAGAGTTTLVARRQQRVLKRWRTSAASTVSILAGTLAPLGLLLVAQTAVLSAATIAATGERPSSPALLAGAVAVGGVLAAGVAFVTAAFTRTPESATITAMPAFLALAGGGMWVTVTPPAEVTWPMLATGGGALAQLVRLAWDGPVRAAGAAGSLAAQGWPAVTVLLALSALAVILATRTFRWDPRG